MAEPFINGDLIGDNEDIDNDEFDSILWFIRTTPQTASRPAEWGPKCRFKTIVSKPFTTSTRQPRTRNMDPPKILPLLKDVVECPTKKSAIKLAKKPTTSPPHRAVNRSRTGPDRTSLDRRLNSSKGVDRGPDRS